MVKKGYTIIEIVIVLAIFTVLLGGSLRLLKVIEKTKSELILDNSVYEVKALLSFSKSFCRKNKIFGNIVIDSTRNEVKFTVIDTGAPVDKRITRTIKLKNSVKISTNISDKVATVNESGFITKAGTIEFKYNEVNIRKITISVGVDTITDKDITGDIIGVNNEELVE